MNYFLKIFLLLFTVSVYAQNDMVISIKSPQAYEMERYGNVPVNLNTGALDLKIPLFNGTIEGADQDVTITLDYNSSGFTPAKRSNYVGSNWFLNFGGIISRETRGVADDNARFPQQLGFLVGAKQYTASNSSIYNGDFDFDYGNGTGIYRLYIDKSAELTSDKYNFNFMGNHGFFYIGNDRQPMIFSNDVNMKIDITNLSDQLKPNHISCEPKVSEIKITDGKGIVYYFGGSSENLDVSYDVGRNNQMPVNLAQPFYEITSWYLKKIEYPNKKRLEIKYKKLNLELNNFCRSYNSHPYGFKSNINFNEAFFDMNFYINQRNQRYGASFTGVQSWGETTGYRYDPAIYYNLVKKVFPEEITFGSTKIMFNYNINNAVDDFYDYKSFKLSNIEIHNNDQETYKVEFNYYRNGYYFFLDKININGKKYGFEYHKKNITLPTPWTFGVDFWGYWNGGHDTENVLIPSYLFNTDTGDFTLTGNSRNPSNTLFDATLLSRVIYPTAGFTQFTYEPHQFSQKIDRSSSSQFLPYLKTVNGTIGGARIAKIEDGDGVKTITKEYKYTKDFSPTVQVGPSTGISNSYVRLFSYLNVNNGAGGRYYDVTEMSNSLSTSTFSVSPINYSEVSEIVNGVLSKRFYFSNLGQISDSIILRKSLIPNVAWSDYKPEHLVENINVKSPSMDHYRNNLLKTVYYKNNLPIKEISNKYSRLSDHPLLQNNYISTAVKYAIWVAFQKEFVYPSVLSETITKDYLDGSTIEYSEKFNYKDSESLNLSEKIFKDSDLKLRSTSFTYAKPTNNLFLWEKNMKGIPLQTIVKKSGKVTSQTISEYPQTSEEAELKTSGLPLPYAIRKKSLSDVSKYDIIEYTKYDKDNGNLLEYKVNGVPTTVVWGYNLTLPLAIVTGATSSYVQSLDETDLLVEASDEDGKQGTNNNETNLTIKMDDFRKKLSNYQIVSYTHDPLVGVRSITPASGIGESFLYDAQNRLSSVKDKKNNILREYHYNYGAERFYNEKMSKTFYRNNCGSNSFGSPYVYTVESNKYYSIISPEDANATAIYDLNSNGQTAANINGSCTSVASCSVVNAPGISGYSTLFLHDNQNIRVQSWFSSGTGLPWKTTGVKIGTITVNCRPKISVFTTNYTDTTNHIDWKIDVRANGDIYLLAFNGTVQDKKSYQVEFVYPIN